MDVSIIMINYNTYDYAVAALDSIKKYTVGLEYEIILIDNASPDGSGERLRKTYEKEGNPAVRFIRAESNLGTSKAFNLGVGYCTGKYILWLNTDILLTDNFIKKLYDFMEKTPECGICGGNLTDGEGRPANGQVRPLPSLKLIKREYKLFVLAFRKIFKKRLSIYHNYTKKPMTVGSVCGADMFVRREVIERIGGLDESFFMYSEETDFEYRMLKETEYKMYSVPSAVLQHFEGGSFAKRLGEERLRTVYESDAKFYSKHFGQEAGLKYLKIRYKGCKKFAFVTRFVKRRRREEFLTRVKVLGEMIASYGKGEN